MITQQQSRSLERTCRIGSDESGKGDYFGPLVTAAVLSTPESDLSLSNWGVRDSKKISDNTILRLALDIEKRCPNSVVSIGPKKYNELHLKMKSVNRLLGWAHARAIENVLQQRECSVAVADQFGDESFIKRSLMQRGKEIELIQMPRAEEDIAVAAASVLARAGFLRWLMQAAQRYSFNFPKGASSEVITAAKNFVKRFGRDKLEEVAKLHFRTTTEVLGS